MRIAWQAAALGAWLALALPARAVPAEDPQAPPAPPAQEEAFPRGAMHEIFDAIAVALPASLDPARFSDPARRESVLEALRALSLNAEDLEAHGAGRGESFRHLSASLARNAREVTRRYEDGRYEEAGFLLQRLSEDCLACHARLPSDRNSPLGDRLVREMELEGLSPPERARLHTAMRQFDAALDTWEALFAAQDVSPAQLDLMGYLGDYLTVCIRVVGDSSRALATLHRLSARSDVPDWLVRDIGAWTRTLEALRARGIDSDDGSVLERARTLIREADALRQVPADNTGLVHDLVASSLLYRYTESRPWRGRDVAEAYYLLGLAESRIDRSYWLSQADFYLETAIRMAPQEPFARDALALLEERTAAGYTGSAGTHIPADVQQNLDALRALVEGG